MKTPKVTLVMAMSADGFITKHEDGLVDWSSKEDKQYFVQATKKAGVIIYGKATYDTFKKPLPGRLNIVLTRKPDPDKNIDGELLFTNQDPQTLLEMLASQGHQEVILAGGAAINRLFLEKQLVDEVHLTIEPYLFGSGKCLVETMNLNLALELMENTLLNQNTILLQYKVKR